MSCRICNRLACEIRPYRARACPNSAETSYRMTRQCCVFSLPASRMAKVSW
jgi:hypothetical protein